MPLCPPGRCFLTSGLRKPLLNVGGSSLHTSHPAPPSLILREPSGHLGPSAILSTRGLGRGGASSFPDLCSWWPDVRYLGNHCFVYFGLFLPFFVISDGGVDPTLVTLFRMEVVSSVVSCLVFEAVVWTPQSCSVSVEHGSPAPAGAGLRHVWAGGSPQGLLVRGQRGCGAAALGKVDFGPAFLRIGIPESGLQCSRGVQARVVSRVCGQRYSQAASLPHRAAAGQTPLPVCPPDVQMERQVDLLAGVSRLRGTGRCVSVDNTGLLQLLSLRRAIRPCAGLSTRPIPQAARLSGHVQDNLGWSAGRRKCWSDRPALLPGGTDAAPVAN